MKHQYFATVVPQPPLFKIVEIVDDDHCYDGDTEIEKNLNDDKSKNKNKHGMYNYKK